MTNKFEKQATPDVVTDGDLAATGYGGLCGGVCRFLPCRARASVVFAQGSLSI